MITVIHGDDIVSSREALFRLKKEKETSLELDTKSLDLSKIKQTFEGGGLFGENKIIIMENLLSLGFKKIVQYLAKEDLSYDVTLWEGKDIKRELLNNFPRARILHFKLKTIIFSFLEKIKPNNAPSMMSSFHEVLKTTEPTVVFYMLVRQFRLLLALSQRNATSEQIDEVNRLAPWQKSKLQKQAFVFSLEKLKSMYKKLFEIDFGQKTGAAPLTLTQSIDFFLLDV